MSSTTHSLSLCLTGDVMTGRGVDQILSHPGDPVLHESYVTDAREYVKLAERAHGPIPRPVAPAYIWGELAARPQWAQADARIINLETSITTSTNYWPGKGIHYRMHPRNIAALAAGGIDCCALANNHVLDWGYVGLAETILTLDAAGIPHSGAGANIAEAAAPAVLVRTPAGRVLVFSIGSACSGIPGAWAAAAERPGVHLIESLTEPAARRLGEQIQQALRPGDVAVVSIHWGGNWGYTVPDEQIRFAHALIEAGVRIVHGHSSHHPKALEIYRGGLILYGCGDLLDDYEGIGGYEAFRPHLRLVYCISIDCRDGRLIEVSLLPVRVRRLRLEAVSAADARWLCALMNRQCKSFRTRLRLREDGVVGVVNV